MTDVMTNPPKAAKFWNRIAKKYARDPVADQASYEYKLDRTAAYMTPDMNVLEFGCGTGTTALIHAPRVAHIDATDFSTAMIDIAKAKLAENPAKNVDFHVSSVEAWTPPEGGYDMVMTHSLLHLVADLEGALVKINACLKPGGIFVSSTVCLWDMSRLLSLGLPLVSWTGLLPRVRALTGNELEGLIEAAGFDIEESWRPPKGQSIFIIARKTASG